MRPRGHVFVDAARYALDVTYARRCIDLAVALARVHAIEAMALVCDVTGKEIDWTVPIPVDGIMS